VELFFVLAAKLSLQIELVERELRESPLADGAGAAALLAGGERQGKGIRERQPQVL
jgi:hypothetical protein